jgi:FtsZ-interacting cell division protein ZipA
MLDFLILLIMTAIIGALVFGYKVARKRGKEVVQEKNKFEAMSNNQLNSMTTVSYRGEEIPMTVLEKRTIWDNITREGKNKVWSDFKKQKYGK